MVTVSNGAGSVLASVAPARGAPIQDVIFASALAVVLVGVVVGLGAMYVRGRLPVLDRIADRAERISGLPAWAALPFAVAGASLTSAVFGFYWDVSWHIDRGRDPGPFANPAHYWIFIGLCGLGIAGALSVLLGSRRPPATAIRIGRRLTAPAGGLLLLLSGGVALAGFPLDDIWHRLFGQDVTLWGPTHIQMIAGASLCTLALFVLQVEARRAAPRRPNRRTFWWVVGGGAFLVGLSTLQGEFDYGVPQFRQVYHPVLIMLAAGIGLVAIRMLVGRGAAIGAALVFLAIRGTLTLVISFAFGRSMLHFPLYLPEAVLVELVALRVPRERPLRFALASGALIGTLGLAAEWGWSHVFMPLPWHLSLLPEAASLGFAAAIAGALIGILIGRALTEDPVRHARVPVGAVVAASALALLCIGYPLPMTAATADTATVSLRTVQRSPNHTVLATVRLRPSDAAAGANWFTITSWQGAGTGDGGLVIADVRRLGPGLYRADRPVPVDGQWKTILRLQTGTEVQVVPIFMPLDQAIPAPLIPALPHFTRHFQPDKKVLQREAVGGSVALQRAAYAAVALLAIVWLAIFGWGLRRVRLTRQTASHQVSEQARAA